jgi:hypothetical protein
LNQGRRGGKPVTNRLSYGAVAIVALCITSSKLVETVISGAIYQISYNQAFIFSRQGLEERLMLYLCFLFAIISGIAYRNIADLL